MKGPNSVDRHVGKRLRLLRLSRGMGLPELAQALGVSTPRLLQLEDGRERISLEFMRELSRILSARPSEFFIGFSMGGEAEAEAPDPRTAQGEVQKLLRDFARVRDPKSRALILSLVAAYAEFGDIEGR